MLRNESYWLFITFCLFSFFWYEIPAYSQELGMYVEQFEAKSDSGTFQIELLRIGRKGNGEMLIRISGVDDPLNEQIYKYRKVWENNEERLKTYKYVTVEIPDIDIHSTFQSENEYGDQVFKVYLLNSAHEAISVSPSSHPRNLNPSALYKEYIDQQNRRGEK